MGPENDGLLQPQEVITHLDTHAPEDTISAINFDDIFEEYYEYGQQIKQYVTDTSVILNDALDQGKRVLFEGAQGVMLDIDQGTYPFVPLEIFAMESRSRFA